MTVLERIKREPVLLSTLAGAALSAATAFGLDLNAEQTAAVMGVVTTLVVIVFGRANATPNVDVAAVNKGVNGGPVAGPAAPVADGTPLAVDLAPELLAGDTDVPATKPATGYWGGM